jgi:hypothetical protein
MQKLNGRFRCSSQLRTHCLVALSLLVGVTGGIPEQMDRARIRVDVVSRSFGSNYKRRDARQAAGDRLGPISLWIPSAGSVSDAASDACRHAAGGRRCGQAALARLVDAEPGWPLPRAAARGWGVLTSMGLVIRIAASAIAGMIVVSSLALFEEIGWRGWLLPRLIGLTSKRRAV